MPSPNEQRHLHLPHDALAVLFVASPSVQLEMQVNAAASDDRSLPLRPLKTATTPVQTHDIGSSAAS